jgi:hypothetical protein
VCIAHACMHKLYDYMGPQGALGMIAARSALHADVHATQRNASRSGSKLNFFLEVACLESS